MEDVLDDFHSYRSIERIRRTIKTNAKFSFQSVSEDLVYEVILNGDGSKATPVGDIPADMLKSAVDLHLPFLTKIMNYSFGNSCFEDTLKLAEVSTIFKTNDDLDKESYRPVSILSHVSKTFERAMYKQIDTFMRDKLSELLTGFRKNHNTQHFLMTMLEMWKNTVGKRGYVSAIFMDLSKAFVALNHNLLNDKLRTSGFEIDSFSFMKCYINDRQQRVHVNNNFSSWEKKIQEFRKVQYLDRFYLTSLSTIFFFLFQVLFSAITVMTTPYMLQVLT